MTRVAVRAALISLSILAISGCEDGVNLGSTSSEPGAAPSAAAASGSVTRDVQRPDIFSTEEEALWDGRPSLGGIWVAHPDVTTPERVIITNKTTGQKIAGALFRRERSNPGPRVQLSSDAAAALNILAGQPTLVSIVVVRQEEVEVEPAEPVISDEEIGEDAEAGGETAAAAAAEEKKPRGNFFQRLFGRKKPAAAAAGTEAAATAESAAAPKVQTQTLDPVAAGAAAAIERAEADDKPAPRPARAAAKPASAPAAAEAPAPSSDLRNPFIQVGLFSQEANAFSASDNLRQAGIVPTVLTGDRDGTPFWRVVVGPMTTADEQTDMLAQIRRLGFRDAFLTSK